MLDTTHYKQIEYRKMNKRLIKNNYG